MQNENTRDVAQKSKDFKYKINSFHQREQEELSRLKLKK